MIKKIKVNDIATHENYIKFKFQCSHVKLYWNTLMLIYFQVVYGWLHAIMAGLSSSEKRYMATKPEIFISIPLQKKIC